MSVVYDKVWFWKKSDMRPIDRKGQRCRIVRYADAMNSILVEFPDGFRVVTSRFAVRNGEHKIADEAG
jgi:hypothetical protein